jgi:hypothetical protein
MEASSCEMYQEWRRQLFIILPGAIVKMPKFANRSLLVQSAGIE